MRSPLRSAGRGVGWLLAIGMTFSLPACGNQLPKEQLLADARGGVTLQQASQGTGTAAGAAIDDPTATAPGAETGSKVGTRSAGLDGAAPVTPRTEPGADAKSGSSAASGGVPTGAKAGTSSQTACIAPKSEVAIGTVGSQSGVIGAAVRPGTEAVKAWVADMNSRGGLNCHPIRYYVADDGADSSRNAALTRQMIEERHVIAMLFSSAPLSSHAGKPILEQAHVPTIGGEGGDEHFNTSPDFFPIAAMGKNLIAANYGMLAGQLTASQRSALGVLTCLEARICSAFGGPEAKAIAEGFGMKVLYSAQSTLVQPDYTSNCQSAKDAGVQAMFVAADGSMLSRAIRSCNRIGFHPQFATSPVALAASVIELPEMEGLLLGGSTQPWTAPSATAKRYLTSLAKYVPGAAPTGAGGLGWASAIVLEWACRNLPDNPTPQDVENGLSTIKNNDFDGYTVPLTYAKGKPASYPVCWWALQIHNKAVVSPNGNQKGCAKDTR